MDNKNKKFSISGINGFWPDSNQPTLTKPMGPPVNPDACPFLGMVVLRFQEPNVLRNHINYTTGQVYWLVILNKNSQ